MAWTTPPTFTALAGATAAMFNKLRDCLNAIGDPWTAYNPAITASTTNPTMGASTVTGRFRNTGKTWDVDVDITLGSGFVAGSGGYIIGLPSGCSALINGASAPVGIGLIRDVSVPAAKTFTAYVLSSATFAMAINSDNSILGAANPYTLATGDRISVKIRGLEST